MNKCYNKYEARACDELVPYFQMFPSFICAYSKRKNCMEYPHLLTCGTAPCYIWYPGIMLNLFFVNSYV